MSKPGEEAEEASHPRVSHRKKPGWILANLFLNASTEGAFATASAWQGIPQAARPNRWKIAIGSVEPGSHQLITVVPHPIHGQFKYRGQVQPTESSTNIKARRISRSWSLLYSRIKSRRSANLLWFPLWRIERSQLGSSGLHLF